MFLIESKQQDTFTELFTFERVNGIKKVTSIKDFKPYFFVLEEEPLPEDNRIIEVKSGYKGLCGEKLKKIVARKSSDIKDLRVLFTKHFEADILVTDRYFIDTIGESQSYPLKIFYFDIELNTETEFPDMKNPNQEVTCISYIDSFENINKTLLLRSPKWLEEPKLENTVIYDTEEELLYGFLKAYNDSDPDIIANWFVEGFDLPYMMRRMKQFNIEPSLFSPLGSVYITEDEDELSVKIKGRIILDSMKLYQYYRKITNQGKADSYSLEFTAQEVLGIGKIPHKETFKELWEQHPIKLVEYNKRDIELVKKIDEKEQIIDFFNNIRCMSCCQFEDIYQSTKLVDCFLLNKCKGKVVLPSKPKRGEDDKFSGAFVLEPTPGLYKNVVCLDVKSLYPNLVKSFNIGYETLNLNGDIKISDTIRFDKGIGLISECVRDLEKEREKNKKLKKQAKTKEEKQMYHFRQYANKVLMNITGFGYLGYNGSRLYKKEVAEAITGMGKKTILWSKAVVENLGYTVLAVDTDSLYIKNKEESLMSIIKEGNELKNIINESYKNFVKSFGSDDCTLEIQFEKAIKSILFVHKRGDEETGAKKKYAYILLWKDGETVSDVVEHTGFSNVRSDSAKIAKDIQREVLEKVLRDGSKDELIAYLKDIDKKIRNKTISVEDIGFPKGISERLADYKVDGPVIKGAKFSNKYLGTRFTKGSKPKWVYIKSVPKGYPKTETLAFTETIPDGFLVDYDKMIERIIEFNVGPIFKSCGFGDLPNTNSTIKSLNEW
jgi:DNA polymerase I